VGTEVDEDKKVTRHVWVDRDGRATKVVVEVGLSDDKWEEITSGLSAGDRVVRGPAKLLRGLIEGERIREAEAKDAGKAKAGADGEADDEAEEEAASE
jgi:HlyD family secretion protein